MDQAKVDQLAELFTSAARMARAGEALASIVESSLQGTLNPKGLTPQFLAGLLQNWRDVKEAYDSLCCDLWTEPERQQAERPTWTPDKVEDVAKAMREGRI